MSQSPLQKRNQLIIRKHEQWLAGLGGERANFTDMDISGSEFDLCNLSKACFKGAKGKFITFLGANLTDADFSGAKFEQAMFDQANLTSANFECAHLTQCPFYQSRLNNVNFIGAAILNSSFRGADLRLANFDGVYIPNCDFTDAILHKVKFLKCAQSVSSSGVCVNFVEIEADNVFFVSGIDKPIPYDESDGSSLEACLNAAQKPEGFDFMGALDGMQFCLSSVTNVPNVPIIPQ